MSAPPTAPGAPAAPVPIPTPTPTPNPTPAAPSPGSSPRGRAPYVALTPAAEPIAAVVPEAGRNVETGLADLPPFRRPGLRPVVGILVLFLLTSGLVYPAIVDGFERATGGLAPSGAFIAGGDPDKIASFAIGQNITNTSLFWLRPSLTDYSFLSNGSGEAPYGPTDPNLLNLTRYYIGVYGLNNTTVPLGLVSNSESGIDPDLTPDAALAQVPRVAFYTHLTEAALTSFVLGHVTMPVLGVIGPEYVNVLILDEDLLHLLAATPPG